MIVLGLLNARYPNGKLYETELVLAIEGDELFVGDRPVPEFEDFMEALTRRYHSQIGPAYAPEDFTYEFWFTESRPEFDVLVGRAVSHA